jgi:hypothetical protein
VSENLVAYLSGESADSGPACFWSYARDDDARIGGKLGEVSQDLANFYEFETGKPLPIFRDVDSIAWGQRWEGRVAHGLQNVMFLIPAVTPNFLKSEACRSEISRFEAVCRARGVDGLILPIVFSGRHLLVEDSADEVAQIIARTQYVPFDEVWFTSRTGELWQQTIRKMVLSLVDIETRAEEQLSRALTREAMNESAESPRDGAPTGGSRRAPINVDELDTDDPDDDPQIAEIIAKLEEDIERLTPLIHEALAHFGEAASAIQRWGDANVRPKNAKAANQYFFQVAKEIDGPGKEFQRASAEAYNIALDIDTNIQRMRQITGEMAEDTAREAFDSAMATGFGGDMSGIRDTVSQIEGLLPVIADAERYSSLLKKSLRPVRGGMQIMRDIGNMMLEWGGSAGSASGQDDEGGPQA